MVKTTQWYCLVVFLWTRTRHTPIFGGEKVEGRSQIRGILFTRRQLPDHDRTMTESLPNTHLKDRISSMSLFIPNRVSELILLFTCLVQKGRLCPHWTKVAEVGKYGKMRNGLRFLELFMHMIKNNRKVIKKLG